MTEQYQPCNINYDCGEEVVGDPQWYPWNNQNDTGISGVTNNVMPLGGVGGFRLFGENISEETEIEVFPTSIRSGTNGGTVTLGSGVYPSFTTVFTPAAGGIPAYITVTPDAGPTDGTYWIRGRNPGGSWVPAPVIIFVGAG